MTVTTNTARVLQGGQVVSLSPFELRREDLWLEGDKIVAPRQGEDHEVIDCSGCLILPGNICGHGHLYSALATGMPAPQSAPTCFVEILERVWWRLDEALDAESLRASALAGAVGAIRAGTTSLIDHHASPSFIDGSLDVIAEALDEVGLRSVLCYEVTDRGGTGKRDAGVRENERFIKADRLFSKGLVGGHAAFTMDPTTLEMCMDVAKRTAAGLHIHAAEDKADQADSEKKHGARVLERLQRAGALSKRTLLVHGVHLSDAERQILQESDAWIAHNPRSNMNNSVGYANPKTLGPRVILGTDGIGADMFAESQHAFFRAREARLDTDAAAVLGWLAQGRELLSDLFQEKIGHLEPGAAADVTILDPTLMTPITAGSLPWHWMFGFSSQLVRDVLVAGRHVVKNREVVSVDAERIAALAREQAERLWSKL